VGDLYGLLQVAGMRPAPPRFKDEVAEGDMPILRRDVISPNKAIAVRVIPLAYTYLSAWLCLSSTLLVSLVVHALLGIVTLSTWPWCATLTSVKVALQMILHKRQWP
jgi:hypothetical protein